VATVLMGVQGLDPRVTHHTAAPRLVMVGYARSNSVPYEAPGPTLTHPTCLSCWT